MNIKLITSVFLFALITFAIGLFPIPWFAFAIGIFVISIAIPLKSSAQSFATAALTVFVLYAIICIKIDFDNEHLLSKKISNIFQLKDKYWILYILTSLFNGLLAGMSALTGSLFRKMLKRRRENYYS